MPPFCFWAKKKPQAFCESLRLCRLLDIQFFVFPHSILLVEQNAKMALSIADRAYVLETGRITMEGDAKELLNNEQVRKAYLG